MRKPWALPFDRRLLIGVGIVVLLSVMGWWLAPQSSPRITKVPTSNADPVSSPPSSPGPPWVYGRADARFTVVEYADLECPYCRAYFPVLKGWIDAHPEVNWQWRHLPLNMHDPAATREARLAECAGEVGGNAAFWKAAAWLYTHTRGDGQGLPQDVSYPGLTTEMQRCLASDRPDAAIRAQVGEARKRGIKVTPTLQLRDRQSGKTIVLAGPVEGDTLLSAIDWLASNDAAGTSTEPASR